MNKITTKLDQAKTLYKNHLWQGRLILATLITILVLLLVRVTLPYTVIYSAIYWLNKQGVAAQIEDISINVHKGTFSVHGASGTKNGTRVFNIGKASIDWEWTPLSKNTIHITDVILEDFKLIAAQYLDAIEVAGILIKDEDTDQQQSAQEDDSIAWGALLNQIDFKDLGFCFTQFDSPYEGHSTENTLLDYCGDIGLLSWRGGFSLGSAGTPETDTGAQLSVDGTFQVEQLKLFNNKLEGALINIGATSLSDIKIRGINDIRLDAIEIAQLSLLQKSGHSRHKHAVALKTLDINGISVSNLDSVTINSIELNQPFISMGRDTTGKYKYEQWLLPQQAADSSSTTEETAEQSGESTAFSIKLGDITITDSETCYEQAPGPDNRSRALDYCLNLSSSKWEGSIAIATPGDKNPFSLSLHGGLLLSRLVTANNLLNRDLLTFETLAINKIAVNGLEDLAFAKLDLDHVSALELTSTENKHTLTVAGLDISDFGYRNNTLSIAKAAINDLGLEITQNKDGTLDFEQWESDISEQQAAAETETGNDEAEPIKIKIGEFSLDTTRLVEFADLSVTPNMLIGLKEIHFDIKELDSENPEHKSPIELSAKTTRHGTIAIKGVVMPFETKPSFDATGKISGLDLRAVSPKAEQAIGHIIKSGQMDADLRLLSVEGKLDSEISLVLHHFKLKAKSKEDAAALDDVFGMPINQSLMLLKDKKERIKLDIPITGDIDNPEFDPTDAIIKATAKATTVTLITFYTPYGLAFAGGNVLFDLATAMNFDPVIFDAGSSQLTDANKEQINKLAELLTERPGVHLTLCGFTNLNDREKMFTEIIDRKKIEPPSAERLQKLRQLGSERQENVKNYLVSVGNIAHDRLILCEPEHNDDIESISGVEISI